MESTAVTAQIGSSWQPGIAVAVTRDMLQRRYASQYALKDSVMYICGGIL